MAERQGGVFAEAVSESIDDLDSLTEFVDTFFYMDSITDDEQFAVFLEMMYEIMGSQMHEEIDCHTFMRAVTVRAINLEPQFIPRQLTLFSDAARRAKLKKLGDTIKIIRGRIGKWSVYSASRIDSMKTSGDSSHEVIMPGIMYVYHRRDIL